MNFFTNLFKNPINDELDEVRKKGHLFYISGGDFDMDVIFSGLTKQDAIENAYQVLKTENPDILKAYADQSSDPIEQDKLFKKSLEFLVDEVN